MIGLIEKVKVIGLIAMNVSAPDNVFLQIVNGICPCCKMYFCKSQSGSSGKVIGLIAMNASAPDNPASPLLVVKCN